MTPHHIISAQNPPSAFLSEPQTLRTTIGLGGDGHPVKVSFGVRVELGCYSNGDRFGGQVNRNTCTNKES